MVVTRSKEEKFYTELESTGQVCCKGTDEQIEGRGVYFGIPRCCIENFINMRRHAHNKRSRWPQSLKNQILVRLNGWRLCQKCTHYISKEDLFFKDYQFILAE